MTQTLLSPRTATISRETKETQIKLSIRLEGDLGRNIDTPLPFFSHMLDAFACHGRFGLDITATGDIEVDPHHLIEDVGITLGQAFKEVLTGYKGIARAGSFAFPMDGSLAVVALDLCNRPNLVWNVKFNPLLVGGIDPNLFREFYKGWVDGAQATLHVHVPCQDNDHHVIEASMKAFGRSLKQACEPIECNTALSTKGTLEV